MTIENAIRLFDAQRVPIGILQNAFNVSETREMNKLNTLSFSLPLDDPMLQFCKAYSIVQVGLTGEKYRLFPKGDDGEDRETPSREFYCEHVLSTLLDKVLRGVIRIGGNSQPTPVAIRALLDLQDEKLWVLGECDFVRYFEYSFENEKILPSLFSIPNCFASDFIWKTNTSGFPWVISLKLIDKSVEAKLSVMYGLNRLRLTRAFDWTKLYTKLYALGAGEGINQLNINDQTGGLGYVISEQSVINEYGVREGIFIDRRYTIGESLYAAAQAKLRVTQKPSNSYESGFIGDAEVGDLVDIVGYEKVFIVKKVINYDEVDSISYSYSTELGDIIASVSSIAERVKIEALYSQGASNMFAFSALDNGDPQNSIVCDFWIPEDMLYVNKVVAKVRMSSFRSYSKAAKSGGGSSRTSSSSGGFSVSSGPSSVNTTAVASKGGTYTGYSAAGGESANTGASGRTSGTPLDSQYDSHNHSYIRPPYRDVGYGYNYGWHRHYDANEFPHSHGIDHTHNVSNGGHSHSVQIPDHEHEIEAGIFLTGDASTFDLYVDGVKKQSISGNDLELDVTAMLIDENGKISRGAWHTISVLPNDLARVSISLVLTGFITSNTGGNF